MRRVPSCALIAVLALACNALTGASDLGVGEGTGTPASTDAEIDAGSGGDGGAPNDSGPIGDSGPVNVLDDAGDAGADVDAAPLGFCASLSPPAALCTDFDDNVFPGPWTPTLNGAGSAGLVTSTFTSAPRALALGSSGSGHAYVTSSFATVAQSEVVVGFSIRVGQARGGENELAVVYLGSAGGNPYQAQLELLDDGALILEEEAPADDGSVPEKNEPLGITIPAGEWRRVTMTIAIGASSSSIRFDIEGSAPVTKAALAHLYKAAPRVVLGHDSPSSSAYSMTYDDAFVRVK